MHVAVVGGGPAGLIAAEVLAEAGCRVTVFEQHRSVGRKFLLAGRSGLNLTHTESADQFVERYVPMEPSLVAAVQAFDADAVRTWCEGLGEATVVGTSGRVFPASHRATPLLRAWLRRLSDLGVELRTGRRWTGWHDETLVFVTDDDGIERVRPDATVLACGGPSWPRVGGDGSWRHAFDDEPVEVASFAPSNCGVFVEWSDLMIARHEGDPLKNIAVRTPHAAPVRGDLMVTRAGFEGGPVYTLARHLRTGEPSDDRRLIIDLMPDLTSERLQARLAKRRSGATQTSWLRGCGLGPVAISLMRDVTGNSLPDDPAAMAALARSVSVRVVGVGSLDRSISSAGGVRFDELDDRFMLRCRPGTFVAGEMLDWEAPTGGYLLQACFSTGVAAARGVLERAADA